MFERETLAISEMVDFAPNAGRDFILAGSPSAH
jgi:hypothetical protein